MTALPTWVSVAMDVLADGRDPPPLESGLPPSAHPDILHRPLYHPNGFVLDMSTLVSTSTSKGAPSFAFGPLNNNWFRYPAFRKTKSCCPKCPQPLLFPEVFGYLKRCTSCGTKARRYSRAQEKLRKINTVESFTGLSSRWVTLTMPNFGDPAEGLKVMKKLFRNFRQTKGYQSKVIASCDFWEWTHSATPLPNISPSGERGGNDSSSAPPSEGSYNVHYHGFWIGDYWKQSDLLKKWRHGGARISDTGGPRKRLNYLIHYAKKQHELGIRCQQLTGCLYGSAFVDVELALTLADELSTAVGVHEE